MEMCEVILGNEGFVEVTRERREGPEKEGEREKNWRPGGERPYQGMRQAEPIE